jgi:hypothetical protein
MCGRPILGRGFLLMGLLGLPAGAIAGDEPGKVELGFVPLSVARLSTGDESLTGLQAPASGFFLWTGDRGLYLQWFASTHLALEPQLSFSGIFGEDDDFKSLNASLRANYLVTGPDRRSPYLYGGGGLAHLSFDGDDGETNPTAGGGLGYRWPIRSAGSVRIEAGYERLFRDQGDDGDFFRLSVGVALRF